MLVGGDSTLDPGVATVSENICVLDTFLGRPVELVSSLIWVIGERKCKNSNRRCGGR